MRFTAIDRHRDKYSVNLMCRALAVSSSGCHAWRRRPLSERCQDELPLVSAIERLHQESNQTYGSPRIYAALTRDGEPCSKDKVARLMRKHGIRAKTKKKFKATTHSKHRFPVAENVLDRNFSPEKPNES